ncbi:MAG: hypothetical protein MUE82_01655 [Chloroflexi bacterium]|jgi:hypothetical protein|nr:hypothetical protein [Chloroflexota bacterium]
MHRRLVALAATALVALAACSGGATATPIADPSEIVTQSLDALSKAKTVHARADVTGTLPFDAGALLGGLSGDGSAPSSSGASMDLAGTYLDATVDIAGKKGTITVAIPFLLGTKLEAIMDGDTSYTRISLFGDTWQKSVASPDPNATPAPSDDLASMVADVQKALSQDGVTTEKLADEKCGEDDCYHVRITAPASALAEDASGLAGGLGGDLGDLGDLAQGLTSPAPGASPLVGGDVTIDWWARKSDLRPMKIVLGTTAAGSTLAVTVTMDKWDEPVTVTPPPADQVTDQPAFELPSFEIPSIEP